MADASTAAREELMLCEQEIQSIKSALRRIGTSNDGEQQNCMEIVLLKVRTVITTSTRESHLCTTLSTSLIVSGGTC